MIFSDPFAKGSKSLFFFSFCVNPELTFCLDTVFHLFLMLLFFLVKGNCVVGN
ncbi:MAG: hypothetical protein K0S53_1650 [Bacteroidetes bacterium]|jgi:hypothetical protein|nr:hypothetical protein [Bacteroidota bacterium]